MPASGRERDRTSEGGSPRQDPVHMPDQAELMRRSQELRRRLHASLRDAAPARYAGSGADAGGAGASEPPSQSELMRRSEELRQQLRQSALYRPMDRSRPRPPVVEKEPEARSRSPPRTPVVLTPARAAKAPSVTTYPGGRGSRRAAPLTLQQLTELARAGTLAERGPEDPQSMMAQPVDVPMMAEPVGVPSRVPEGAAPLTPSSQAEDEGSAPSSPASSKLKPRVFRGQAEAEEDDEEDGEEYEEEEAEAAAEAEARATEGLDDGYSVASEMAEEDAYSPSHELLDDGYALPAAAAAAQDAGEPATMAEAGTNAVAAVGTSDGEGQDPAVATAQPAKAASAPAGTEPQVPEAAVGAAPVVAAATSAAAEAAPPAPADRSVAAGDAAAGGAPPPAETAPAAPQPTANAEAAGTASAAPATGATPAAGDPAARPPPLPGAAPAAAPAAASVAGGQQLPAESAPSRPATRPRAGDDSRLLEGWRALLERTRHHPQYTSEYTRRFQVEGAAWRRTRPGPVSRLVLGLDCEMVYAKDNPNALARVTVVSFTKTLLDLYVRRAPEGILDYRTPISGVEPRHLTEESGALPFEAVQERVLGLIAPETILVGHALQNDLRALRICHLKIVDTALLFAVEGKHHWQKHKLHSLVSLMRPRVATLQSVVAGEAHDSRQDAEWALQIALYEASIHPRRTKPLKLESFPTKIFLSEIPHGTATAEVQALFRGGDVSDISFQLQVPQHSMLPGDQAGEWLGCASVTFQTQAERDAAVTALARFACVYVGPLRDWAVRRDVVRMQGELVEHFSRYGRVRGCRVFRPRAGPGQAAFPVAQLTCHPATARALLTKGEAHSFATHRSLFKVRLAEEDSKRRCIVPLGSGHFVAKIQ
uniref:Exonuclease domain-containing protein n=1 Tax=Alexandrium monilatum TaxID=311494 RepID=A0A7S4R9Z0_9DINO